MRQLFRELKRRNVYKGAVTYLVSAFVAIQAANLLVPETTLPAGSETFVIYVAIVGFPIALVIAWAFELTPEEITSQAILWTVPEHDAFPEEVRGHDVFVTGALYAGEPEEGDRALRPLRELSEPVLDMSGIAPYTFVQTSFDPFYPSGDGRYYWKSTDLDRLDADAIGALVRHGRERPSPRTHLIVWHQDGTMGRVPTEVTAFGDRSAPYTLTIDSTWFDPARDEENVSWTRSVWDDLQRFSTGGLYLNFPGMGAEGEELVRTAYGEGYRRLVELKNRWDPDNLFRMNQNIEPTV